jgi:hypothetical protein
MELEASLKEWQPDAAVAAVLIRAHAPEMALVHRWLDSCAGIGLIVGMYPV